MIDFHCHLDLYESPESAANAANSAGVYVLSVTTTPKAWRITSKLGKQRKFIRTALGLHPQLAHERSSELPLFEKLVEETRYVGEIGLDGSPDFREFAQNQLDVFERVLSISRAGGGRIYSIHSKAAATEVISALIRFKCAETSVLHWFSGSKSELKAAIASGCWFSVGPAMLRSEKGLAMASLMPSNRVLTETDGPFGQVQGRALAPTDVGIAEEQLAKLWGLELPGVRARLMSNLKDLTSRIPGG